MPASNKKRKRNVSEDEVLRARERENLINRPRSAVQSQMSKIVARMHRLAKHSQQITLPHEHEAEMRDAELQRSREVAAYREEKEQNLRDLAHTLALLRHDTAEAQIALDREHEKKDLLNSQISIKKDAHAGFLRNMSELRSQLAENQLNERKCTKESEKIAEQIGAANALRDSLQRELERAVAARDQSITDAATAETQRRTAQDDYDLLIAKTSAEAEELADQKAHLESTPEELEAALRKAFQEQLVKIIAERKRQFAEDNAEGMQELKKRYSLKWNDYDSQLTDIDDQNIDLQNQLDRLNEQIRDARLRNEPARRLEAAVKEVNRLRGSITNANDRWARISAKNKLKLEHLRAQVNKKDREYDDLMDLKVAMAMEIKAYSGLLENEEDRLGYVSPIKRARDRILEEIQSSNSQMEESP